MQLNVLRELRQPLGSVTTYDVHEDLVSLVDVQLKRLTGVLTLLRTDLGLLVSIRATTSVEETCARCLRDTESAVEVQFEEEYFPVVDAATGERVHGHESEEHFRIGASFVLDLREALRQYVLMSEPRKPLCKPGCLGLCVHCGADLNNAKCKCPLERDERWEVLSSLNKANNEGS